MSYFSYSIDIVGNCNLRCPSCPVGNIDLKHTRPSGMIKKELFYEIIDKIAKENIDTNPWVSLYDWGEPTLHHDLPLLVEYLNKKLRSRISSNLNFEADFRSIVKSNPTEFKISISGFYKESYSKTHFRGDINKVKSNIYKLKQYKDQFSVNTKFIMNYHLYKHNLGEDYTMLENLCKELDFEFRPYPALFMPIEKVLSLISENKKILIEELNINLPKITEDDYNLISLLLTNPVEEFNKWEKKKMGEKKENKFCARKENKIPIRMDGSVPICCGVYGGEFKVVENFLDKSHAEIQSLRGKYNLCKICVENGAHLNWKSDQKSLLHRNLHKNTVFSKVLRSLYDKKYKSLINNFKN